MFLFISFLFLKPVVTAVNTTTTKNDGYSSFLGLISWVSFKERLRDQCDINLCTN